MPYTINRVMAKNKFDPNDKIFQEYYQPSELPYHRERYYKIPVHMIFSINGSSDKKDAHRHYIDISTKDFRNVRFIVSKYREMEEI